MARASREFLVDVHPACYDVSLTPGWARRIMSIRGMSEELDEAVFDYAAELRGAAHSARLPLEILRVMKASHESVTRDRRNETPVEKLANYITVNLGRKIPTLSVEQLNAVRGVCLELSSQFADLREDPRLGFPWHETWGHLLETGQFKLVLWSLQRTSYVAVYNAYESFSTRCAALASSLPRLRRTDRKFASIVKNAFDESILESCYCGEPIRRAALMRHALAHAAGKKTHDLEKYGFVDRVQGGRVQITVADVRELLRLVENRGLKIATATAAKFDGVKPR